MRSAGSAVAQTVTSAEEAGLAADAGVDLLIVQGSAAGGHSATLTRTGRRSRVRCRTWCARWRARVGRPSSQPVAWTRRPLSPKACAPVPPRPCVGTALLLTEEAGTSAVHRAAILERSGPTLVTRAFTGRPARALPNEFTRRFDPVAPLGYPPCTT